MPNFEDLEFVRVIDPQGFRWIPRYLFNQISELSGALIDNIYQYGSSILTTIAPDGQGRFLRVPNPLVWLVVLHDVEHKIKGVLWAEIDIVENRIFVQAYSVDKKYQSKDGEALKAAADYLFNLPVDKKFKQKIEMATVKPEAFEKIGWRRSQKTLMELKKDDTETNTD